MKNLFYLFVFFISIAVVPQLPKGFVYVQDEIPSLQIELRYFSFNNFVGDTINGYLANRLILSSKAAEALKLVQQELNKEGLGLKVFDGYRPQRAVNHFMEWANKLNDTIMKHQYYPDVDKKELFKEGYIAVKSSHSRGSTVDVTLIDLETRKELDMGSPYDFFGSESWVKYKGITKAQKQHRKLLQKIMKKYEFYNYPQEWWHFTLKHEPFTDTYFNFVIE